MLPIVHGYRKNGRIRQSSIQGIAMMRTELILFSFPLWVEVNTTVCLFFGPPVRNPYRQNYIRNEREVAVSIYLFVNLYALFDFGVLG